MLLVSSDGYSVTIIKHVWWQLTALHHQFREHAVTKYYMKECQKWYHLHPKTIFLVV